MKDLVNRYLNAVRFWLPPKQRDDIIQELSEDLRSQIEDQEAVLGRDLNEDEVAEMLKKCGNPFLVGGRYRNDLEWVASPMLQVYSFVLRIVLLWVLTPLLAIIYIPAILTAKNPASAILASIPQIWLALVFAIGMITIVFGTYVEPCQASGRSNGIRRCSPKQRTRIESR